MDFEAMDFLGVADEKSPVMKTIKTAATVFVYGAAYGTISTLLYYPRVRTTLPVLIQMAKRPPGYGAMYGATAGIYMGVEQMLLNYRKKQDSYNGAVAGFVAGASFMCYARSYWAAIPYGAFCAFTSTFIRSRDHTDSSKEQDPSTAEKGPNAD